MVIDTPFEILRVAKKFRPAMRAYWMMAANDPILAIYVTVTELPLKGKLTRLSIGYPADCPDSSQVPEHGS
jgi:hypothetical protein